MSKMLYPPSPVIADKSFLLPNANFKKQAVRVIVSICCFFFVYPLVVLLAVILGCLGVYFGFWLMSTQIGLLTLMLGGAILVTSFAAIYFVLQFQFVRLGREKISHIEITEVEHPVLFDFIRQISREAGTSFPRRIYLSQEVNASVFYIPTFWSMFFPKRRNLVIGAGLINALNITAFKAAMAHEFGHFSQQSLQLGGYIYHVNRLIYSMVRDDERVNGFIEGMEKVNGVLALVAYAADILVKAVMYVMKRLYAYVNRTYMSLSREMEFHADMVGASLAGSNNAITSLVSTEYANAAMNALGDKLNLLFAEGKVSRNVYLNHRSVMLINAKSRSWEVNNGLPLIPDNFSKSFATSRVNYKDQWASHPSLEDRSTSLKALNIEGITDNRSAWELFESPEKVQEEISQLFYAEVDITRATVITPAAFEQFYTGEITRYALPAVYLGFYDGRNIDLKGWDMDEISQETRLRTFDEIYNESNGQLYNKIRRNQADLEILHAIRTGKIQVNTFDFDGKKFGADKAATLAAALEDEIEEQELLLKELDKEGFVLFNNQDAAIGNQYHSLKLEQQFVEDFLAIAIEIEQIITPFYNHELTVTYITDTLDAMKQQQIPKLKALLTQVLDKQWAAEEKWNSRISAFIKADYVYFSQNSIPPGELKELESVHSNVGFINEEMIALRSILSEVHGKNIEWLFIQFKALLERQLEIPEIRDMVAV
ncbi:M48 family metallopeptidase [Chitinophaga sp. Cy-1792]|uniref:M48 family metallopeptidase n=1 Tax=Chitinophaga sp. Cy-1792 TaxID=2608339 RepID=UPI00141F3C1B|nr:M48 family metallopeptidase [Chitinophaga sp. Cy-1792]NIG54092.1 M48 family metalloprotease [Chitinophaga sp. Cy-1792]